jgi:hypothetical protein
MTGLRVRTALLGIVLAIVGVTPALAQDEPRVSISTSINYSVGDYGTGKDTTLLYMPFTLGVRPFDRFWLNVTVPFISQTTQNVVLTGGGVAVRSKGNGKLARPATSTTESGLGDVLAKASVVLVEEKDFVPEITPYVKIKFPTADKDRGLGTGEYDETIGLDLSKRLVGSLFGYLGLAYTFIGEPPGTDLHNSFGWSVGAAYAVTTPFSVFAFVDGATAISPGEDDPLEVRVGAEYKVTKALKFTGAVTRGLSNGSPDWGIAGGLALRF